MTWVGRVIVRTDRREIHYAGKDYNLGTQTPSMESDSNASDEDRWVKIRVEIPNDLPWEEIKNIEDQISEATGEILAEHNLERQSHHRIVEADYTEYSSDTSD